MTSFVMPTAFSPFPTHFELCEFLAVFGLGFQGDQDRKELMSGGLATHPFIATHCNRNRHTKFLDFLWGHWMLDVQGGGARGDQGGMELGSPQHHSVLRLPGWHQSTITNSQGKTPTDASVDRLHVKLKSQFTPPLSLRWVVPPFPPPSCCRG